MGHKVTAAAKLLERTTISFNPKEAQDPLELLDMCVKGLQDRSGTTREAAMTALVGALEAVPPLDEIDIRCFMIFVLCGLSIKEGSLREARLAYRAVGLLAITLRSGSPWLLAQSFPLLSRTLKVHQASHNVDAPTLVVAALDCLAAVTFAGAQDKEGVERSMKAIWDVILPLTPRPSKLSGGASSTKATSPKVLVAAISTWTFLMTTITTFPNELRKADAAAWKATVAILAALLDHDSRSIRMAAGEALAVCVELNLTQHTPRRDMEALAAKVSDLSAEAAGRGVDNTMLSEQKDLFRQIAAFLDHDEGPNESLPTLADGCVALHVSTWAKLVQLNFLRRFLGSGFVEHVQGNEFFKEAFSYGAEEGKVLLISKKKQNTKMKDKDLKMKRDWTWQYRNIFGSYRAKSNPELLLQFWH